MTKRTPLNYPVNDLSNKLKKSSGKGLDALFPSAKADKSQPKPVVSRYRDTTTPRNRDTTVSQDETSLIEMVRKAVKELGKEAATYRFTKAEKKQLSDVVFAYKGQGLRTSENELTRISINYLLEDYHTNGKSSVLAKVLNALNS